MIKFRRIGYHEVDLLKNMTLRKADMDELRAATGKHPWDALKFSVLHSNEFTDISYEDETGEIINVFGLASSQGIGIPWMLASPRLTKYQKLLMSYSKRIIEEMLFLFPLLLNHVDSRNEVHIRWLQHMGFKFTGVEYAINGIMFRQFYMERK